jgi:undecaprenyl-diphosphatase
LTRFADSIEAIDRAGFTLINKTLSHGLLDPLMLFVTEKWNFIVPVAFVIFYLVVKGGRQGRWVVFCTILLIAMTDASATALRSYFQRVRPCQALQGVRLLVGCSDSFAFPSNHATNAFALAAFLAVSHRKVAIPLFVLAAIVGYSRIYVGVHYPSDVIGGAILGVALALVIGASARWLGRRRATEREAYREPGTSHPTQSGTPTAS